LQPAHFSDRFDTGPQIKMIGISEQDLDAQLFQQILRNALDRAERSHRHEDRRFDLSMRSDEFASAGGAAGGFNLELDRHSEDSKGLQRSEVRLQKWSPIF